MKYSTLYVLLAFIVVAGVAAVFLQSTTPEAESLAVIGGDRDEHGCLGPAGYTYDETIGACVRNFELTPDIAAAAKLAVEYAGTGYALTVVSFNAYEEPGAYDIMLERGVERTGETVYIRGGAVVTDVEDAAVPPQETIQDGQGDNERQNQNSSGSNSSSKR